MLHGDRLKILHCQCLVFLRSSRMHPGWNRCSA
jgi:hypothetical protein